MEGQKDNVLNLFYLFNEGDLYKIEEDLTLFNTEKPTLNPAVSEEILVAKTPDTTSIAQTAEAPAKPVAEVALPKEVSAVIVADVEKEAPVPELKIETATIEETPPTIAVTQPVSTIEQPITEPDRTEKMLKSTPVIPVIPESEPTKVAHTIFLVVNEARSVSLNVYDEAFLEKVLQAVGVSLDKVTLINVNGLLNPDYHYIFREKQVRQFISFGVPMEELNLYLPLLPYEVKLFHGIQFLYTDSLEGIRTDIERKKWLWTALKLMFGMK